VIALYVLLRRMTRQRWPSALVAALFAVHPQHVESVAWISERKDVLSAFLALLSLLAYQRYAARRGGGAYALSLALFALALLGKPMVVTLPFVMLLLDYWPLDRLRISDRRTWWPRVREKLPFFALSVIFSLIAYWAQRTGGSVGSADHYPLPRRLANAAVSCLHYLEQTFWPAKLSIFYPYPDHFPPGEGALAVALLLAITALALLLARRCRYLPVGWFWFLGMLIPVIGLVQIGRQSMADRYVYLPHIGLFIAIAWSVRDLTARSRNAGRIAAGISAGAVIALAATTVHQLGYWKNSTTLFTHALAVTDDNYLAHHQLGNELARENPPDFAAAERQYRQALAINPAHAKSHLNLGNILARRRADAEAIEQFEAALRLDPRLEAARRSLDYVRSRSAATRPAAPAVTHPSTRPLTRPATPALTRPAGPAVTHPAS
jgi:tetratricopeptide (TPR) repeat protein